jgi:hypothetical protein
MPSEVKSAFRYGKGDAGPAIAPPKLPKIKNLYTSELDRLKFSETT